MKDYRVLLKEEFEKRCQKNSAYSLRAFARYLNLSSARLSEILNGKSGLSRALAVKIAKKIYSDPLEVEVFGDLVESVHARSHIKRQLAAFRLQKHFSPEYQQIRDDTFSMISDWYHFTILELCELKSFRSDLGWIAAALEIGLKEATEAVERLTRLGLLTTVNGRLTPTASFTATPDGVPSDALKKFHAQILTKAQAAIRSQAVETRDISSTILSIESTDLAEAKTMIKEFRRKLNARMATSERRDNVYCLSIQFFNLTPNFETRKTKEALGATPLL